MTRSISGVIGVGKSPFRYPFWLEKAFSRNFVNAKNYPRGLLNLPETARKANLLVVKNLRFLLFFGAPLNSCPPPLVDAFSPSPRAHTNSYMYPLHTFPSVQVLVKDRPPYLPTRRTPGVGGLRGLRPLPPTPKTRIRKGDRTRQRKHAANFGFELRETLGREIRKRNLEEKFG